MADSTVSSNIVSIGSRDALTEILREGAQQMLGQAIEHEVAEYVAHELDCFGRGERSSPLFATFLQTLRMVQKLIRVLLVHLQEVEIGTRPGIGQKQERFGWL